MPVCESLINDGIARLSHSPQAIWGFNLSLQIYINKTHYSDAQLHWFLLDCDQKQREIVGFFAIAITLTNFQSIYLYPFLKNIHHFAGIIMMKVLVCVTVLSLIAFAEARKQLSCKAAPGSVLYFLAKSRDHPISCATSSGEFEVTKEQYDDVIDRLEKTEMELSSTKSGRWRHSGVFWVSYLFR